MIKKRTYRHLKKQAKSKSQKRMRIPDSKKAIQKKTKLKQEVSIKKFTDLGTVISF